MLKAAKLAFLLSLPLSAQAALPDAFASLTPLIQRLCEKSPEIVNANESVGLAEDASRVSSRYLIPKVSLGASFGLVPSTPGNESFAGAGSAGVLGATVDWGLNPLFGPALTAERSRAQLSQARVSRIQGLQTQISDFLDQILSLSRLLAREKDLLESQKRLEKQLRTAQSSVRQGIAKRTDQQRFETEVLRLQESKLSLERSRFEAMERLKVLLGGELDMNWNLAWQSFNAIPVQNPTTENPTPDLQQEELRAKIAELDLAITRQNTGLVTSLQGQYAYQNSTLAPGWNSDSFREPWNSNWSLFLNLRYPLWDNGADALTRRTSTVADRVAQVRLEQARRNFQATIQLFNDQRARVEERRRIADRLFALEQRTFQQVELDYREGRTGYLEWLNANQSLQSAVSSQIDASVEWARLWILSATLKGELANDFCN